MDSRKSYFFEKRKTFLHAVVSKPAKSSNILDFNAFFIN